MSTIKFESKKGGVPFPRTAAEWQEKINPASGANYTAAEADHKLCQEVFGHDYKIDAKGFPIEAGIGSAANPSDESSRAKQAEESALAQAKMRLGWRKGLQFDPKTAA